METGASIWVPPAHGFRQVAQVRKAVRDYDSQLDFGKNERNGQWYIFYPQGTNEFSKDCDFGVLGFPDVPSPEHAIQRLQETDSRRRDILREIERHNANIRREQDRKHADVDGDVAEHFEWGFRHMDSDKNPTRKVFMPGKGIE